MPYLVLSESNLVAQTYSIQVALDNLDMRGWTLVEVRQGKQAYVDPFGNVYPADEAMWVFYHPDKNINKRGAEYPAGWEPPART